MFLIEYIYNMRLFKKKDKRYNTDFDNYINKYSDYMKLSVIHVIIYFIIYGLYTLYTTYIK